MECNLITPKSNYFKRNNNSNLIWLMTYTKHISYENIYLKKLLSYLGYLEDDAKCFQQEVT